MRLLLLLGGSSPLSGAASLYGPGTLTAAPQLSLSGAAALDGAGTLTVAPLLSLSGAAVLGGLGTITASPQLSLLGSAPLAGIGAITAAPLLSLAGSAALAGIGTLTASPQQSSSGATLAGSGSMTASPQLSLLGSANLLGCGRVDPDGSTPLYAASNLTAIGTLTATGQIGVPVWRGPPTLLLFCGRTLFVTPFRPVRDWDILETIMSLIHATNAFDGVYASDRPELKGRKAESKAIAIVSPMGWDETEGGYDDPDETQWLRKVEWKLQIIARNSDPHIRDRHAERLVNIAQGAVDADLSLNGVCLIGLTHLYKGRYLPAIPPERTIEAIGTFSYFINGPSDHATEP